MNSQWASAAIDLDGDHRMDFSYQAIAPGTVNAQHWLHPFSNHRILVPLRTPRVGTLVGPTAAAGSWWTNAPVLLWREGGLPDPIAEGTNGHVAVEFGTGTGPRYGWIQFNSYRKIHGVIGFETIYSSYFDFIDYGVHSPSGQPVLVGAGSAAPELTLQDGTAHLSWNSLRSRSSLEWSGTLSPNDWSVLTSGDQSSYTFTIPSGTSQAFFRLRPPVPNPPAIQ